MGCMTALCLSANLREEAFTRAGGAHPPVGIDIQSSIIASDRGPSKLDAISEV